MSLTEEEKAVLRKLGHKNGKRRLETMTSEQRIAAARHAATARWDKSRAAAAARKPEAAA